MEDVISSEKTNSFKWELKVKEEEK